LKSNEYHPKGGASDHMKLMQNIYEDACMKCTADVSDLRDLETMRSRVEKEGISFFTITLPQFAKDLEQALANGNIGPTLFRSFRKSGSIPAFLQGMIGRIFNRETGGIDNEENEDFPTIVGCIRQICRAFNKIEIECTPERVALAFENYTAIEQSFDVFSVPEEVHAKFISVASVLWGPMVSSIELTGCIPKHGPGATAECFHGNAKYQWSSWHDRLEPYFPLVHNGYPLGIPVDSEELQMVSIIPEALELPVRVVSVPKTLKSPRIIAIEPCCLQYTQHGIQDALCRAIESNWLTAGHVNFRDQSINQKLAMSSSKTGRLATIDLSDASDRVPHDLAMEMFRSNPDLQAAIEACRSTHAQLPNGTVLGPLKKFASMGSALCFPVEAMYFYTICVVAILEQHNLPVIPQTCFKASRGVHVYGDDIIVPTTYAVSVLDYLRKYNCKVNTDKTFLTGKFRESCGEDCYGGKSVTPTYVNQQPPKNRRQAKQLISWTASANSFYLKGYWRTASFMFKTIERILGPLPYVSDRSSALGRISYLGYKSASRWNCKLQRHEILAWVPSPVDRADSLEGYGALMKCLLALEARDEKSGPLEVTKQHLSKSALHGAVTLKRRWVPTLI